MYLYVDLDVELRAWDILFVGGNAKTYMTKYAEMKSFSPNTMEYAFTAGLRFGIVEVGFRHYCMHPVIPWIYHIEVAPQWEGSYEELYLKITGEY
jgi:hypothetical protein